MKKISKGKLMLCIIFIMYQFFINMFSISPFFSFLGVILYILVVLSWNITFEKKIIICFFYSLLCSGRFSFLGINIRADDIIFIIMLSYIINKGFKSKLMIDSIDKWIGVYLFYNVLILLISCYLGDNQLKFFIILMKEFEYFTYYLFFKNVIKNKDVFDFSIEFFSLFSIANIIWGLYQIIKSIVIYYGISCLASPAPAQSGGVFLMISLFYFFLFIYKNNKYIFLFLISALLTFSTVSRTAILGLLLFFALVIIHSIIKTIKKNKVSKKVVLAIVILLFALFFAEINKNLTNSYYYNTIVSRFYRADEAKEVRIQKWKNHLNYLDSYGFIFGKGKGFSQYKKGSLTLDVDSEYVNKILECGIVGLSIFFIILIKILNQKYPSGKTSFLRTYIFNIVIVYMLLGVTMEIFSTLLQASLFWTFIGLFSLNNVLLISKEGDD